MRRLKVVTVVGTRPEGIKMAPVIRALAERRECFEHVLVSTSQHREMLKQVLDVFEIRPDVDLDLMAPDQSPAQFAARALASLAEVFSQLAPDVVLVQGDTTTAMVGGLAAIYQEAKLGHVEAGLRSFNPRNPFPEEVNRRISGCLANYHFAPTEQARNNLLREGVPPSGIFVTGNTIVDALNIVHDLNPVSGDTVESQFLGRNRLLLVTAHRRENHGTPLKSICEALRTLVSAFDDLDIAFLVHPNPRVGQSVREILGSTPRVHLLEPVAYGEMLGLMRRCSFILTDSGGLQEEAPSFRKPVLVLRDVTERPELIECGAGRLVGTNVSRIVEEASMLLTDAKKYQAMSAVENPFGDGRASERIVELLANLPGTE